MREFSTDCRRCPRLARHLDQVRARYPGYYARPVAPFGPGRARLLVVGLAPGLHGANRTGRPFTGDKAGTLLYETLHRYGHADRPVSAGLRDGMQLNQCRITNAVKCLPPANQPRPDEVTRCNGYLREEINDLPEGAAILALGAIAHNAVMRATGAKRSRHPFRHGARYQLERELVLFDSYHCSRYNTQTKRLTPAMFRRVFDAIRSHLAIAGRRGRRRMPAMASNRHRPEQPVGLNAPDRLLTAKPPVDFE